jgi:HSP90 family molecular chaperone
MTKVQQKVYLITEEQRDALLNYLLNRPYREVANGVQFLTDAPTTILNIEVPEQKSPNISSEESKEDNQQELEDEKFTLSREEVALSS